MDRNREEIYPRLISKEFPDDITRLILASGYGFTELLRYLIPKVNIHIWNDRPLRESAQFGQLESVQILLDNGAYLLDSYEGPLRVAIEEGHIDLVRYLIQRGADFRTLRFLFLARYNLEIFKYLLGLGLSIEEELLSDCVWSGSNLNVFRFLLKVRSWSQNLLDNVLSSAIWVSNIEMAQILIEKGAKIARPTYSNDFESSEIKAFIEDHP